MNTKKKIWGRRICSLILASAAASACMPGAFANYNATVKADLLNMRKSPGGEIITRLSQGTKIVVLDNSDKTWYKISVNGQEGYVSGMYVAGAADNAPQTTPTPSTSTPSTNTGTNTSGTSTGKIKCQTSVNLRSEPNTSCSVLASLPNNTTVTVTGKSGNWYSIIYNGKKGYVSADYLTVSQTSPTGTPATPSTQTPAPGANTTASQKGRIKCATSVNLRSQPNTSSGILASLPNNTVVTVNGKNGNWYSVTYDGKSGYIHPDYLTLESIDDTGPASNENPGSILKPSANATSYTGGQSKRDDVLAFAEKFLGIPYIYAGSTPNGFDCSGFVYYVFGNTVGSLPRVAQSQFDATTRVSLEELLPGDLVFFGSSGYSITHVGIYAGKNSDGVDEFIHSPHTGDVVKFSTLTGSYLTRFQGGGRVIFD